VVQQILNKETPIAYDRIVYWVIWFLKHDASIPAAMFIKDVFDCGLGESVAIRNIIKMRHM